MGLNTIYNQSISLRRWGIHIKIKLFSETINNTKLTEAHWAHLSLVDWLIMKCFTPYRRYFGHITAATINNRWPFVKYWSFPGGRHEEKNVRVISTNRNLIQNKQGKFLWNWMTEPFLSKIDDCIITRNFQWSPLISFLNHGAVTKFIHWLLLLREVSDVVRGPIIFFTNSSNDYISEVRFISFNYQKKKSHKNMNSRTQPW